MFHPIRVPAEAVMLYNVVKLKDGVSIEDVEMTLGDMCYAVKSNYPEFISGQVLKFTGAISKEGSVNAPTIADDHIAIITYWISLEAHERSHADELFKSHFCGLLEMSESAYELAYEVMWQGENPDTSFKFDES